MQKKTQSKANPANMSIESIKSRNKFQMIQDHLLKYKNLRNNLNQSQNFSKDLKAQLFKLGSECNSLLIVVTSMISEITQLKSLVPKMQKQWNYTKEEMKRIRYKIQKVQIKQKQYEQRVRRFNEMFKQKEEKNQSLKDKIQKLQDQLIEQKQKKQIIQEGLKNVQSKQKSDDSQSLKLCSNKYSVKLNHCDEMELQILINKTKLKKVKEEKDQVSRKNQVLKMNIDKFQQKINEVNKYLFQNSTIPHFNQLQINKKQENVKQQQNTGSYQNKQKITKYHHSSSIRQNSAQELNQNLKQITHNLPNHIASTLSAFQNLKSKTILESLIQKHTHMSKLQQEYAYNLQQSYVLISELSKINSVLESEIVKENSKISSFSIKGKKYAEKHTKSIN